jgi:hypothetical protein
MDNYHEAAAEGANKMSLAEELYNEILQNAMKSMSSVMMKGALSALVKEEDALKAVKAVSTAFAVVMAGSFHSLDTADWISAEEKQEFREHLMLIITKQTTPQQNQDYIRNL